MGIILFRVISTVLLITPLSVFALEWSPQLEPAKEEAFRQPTETFRIKIPDSISVETLQTLALELDNIDVTAMVTREGSYAVFTPIQPITWGNHTLRLVEYAEDGSIFEKGFWTFEVRTQSGIRETDFSANINLSAESRIADENIGIPEPDKLTAQGSASLQGKIAGQEWDVSGNMDLIYNSQQTGNNRELDLGEYLITAQNRSMDFPGFARHLIALKSNSIRGVYEQQQTVHRRI